MFNFIKTARKCFEKKALQIEKRIRFVISSFILTFILIVSTFYYFDKALIFIPVFIIAAYSLTYFALIEDIKEIEWYTLFLMPVIFTISFYLFYFLFPIRWITRIPFVAIYAVSIYAILLTSNIFNVGVEKNLRLYRAAFSINFFYQIFIVFFIFITIFSFHLNFLLNGLLVGITVFILSLYLYWTLKLKMFFEKENFSYAFLTAVVLGEIALILSFIPIKTTIIGLFLASTYYGLAALIYNFLDNRLFKETIREYIFVIGFVFILMLLSINW